MSTFAAANSGERCGHEAASLAPATLFPFGFYNAVWNSRIFYCIRTLEFDRKVADISLSFERDGTILSLSSFKAEVRLILPSARNDLFRQAFVSTVLKWRKCVHVLRLGSPANATTYSASFMVRPFQPLRAQSDLLVVLSDGMAKSSRPKTGLATCRYRG